MKKGLLNTWVAEEILSAYGRHPETRGKQLKAISVLLFLFIGCCEPEEQPYFRAVVFANQIGDTLYAVEERDLRYPHVEWWKRVEEFKSYEDAVACAAERNAAEIKARLDAEKVRFRRVK